MTAPTPYHVTLHLPMLPRMNTSDRVHRWVQIKEKKAIEQAVGAQLMGRVPKHPLERTRVRVTRRSGSRRPDFENLTQGAKHIFDALTLYGVIVDDGPEFVEREYLWEPAKRGKGFVSVEIEAR